MGWVLAKGNAGDIVADDVNIYSSTNCVHVIRHSNKNEVADKPAAKMDEAAIRQLTGLAGGAVDGALSSKTFKASQASTITGASMTFLEPEIVKAHKAQSEMLQKYRDKLEEISKLADKATVSIADWFDQWEEYIESIPSMSADGTIVYEVEKVDGEWKYNGNAEEMDSEWMKAINDTKGKLCHKINIKLERVTKSIEQIINDLLDHIKTCKPFIFIIQLIQKVPSLPDIIKWAKSVIQFLVETYLLFYNLFMTAMQVLEMCVIRFPQLISKLMSKLLKLNCSKYMKTHTIVVKNPFEKDENKDKK